MTRVVDIENCTICGRAIPADEWARVKREPTERGQHIVVACALHTDETVASNWNEKSTADPSQLPEQDEE